MKTLILHRVQADSGIGPQFEAQKAGNQKHPIGANYRNAPK
jgi:hypothetical protein